MFRPADDRKPPPVMPLAMLLGLALGLRLALGLFLPADQAFVEQLPDQVEYLQIAQSVLAGDGFVIVDERYPTPQTLLAQRMPGYPMLLAACWGAVPIVRIVQAAIDASAVLAAYLLARLWLAAGPSLLASALVAL